MFLKMPISSLTDGYRLKETMRLRQASAWKKWRTS